jgi:hypothetical protein
MILIIEVITYLLTPGAVSPYLVLNHLIIQLCRNISTLLQAKVKELPLLV